MSLLRHLPNALTCCNLLCGCLGIIFLNHSDYYLMSAMFVVIAGVFDFFDGFAARMLKVSSPIGKDLDSLADMVTFGVLPSLITYNYFVRMVDYKNYIGLVALLLAVCSAL